ncbi:hypothetical protein S2M10_26720 [Sphingomonas sp. S2M10]|mgnify:CR=1 FL=1|jgi:hypothetical protein|uniref:hypothetical protein n=1 Tax=Sphingomonas sp. S2M10 TaxID=2705010 RepID=UPI001457543D|nr:hypothetical protein [Sphingomonas sp. S2M10]NLS27672.1 hypothetical protein [Sphingomonas sp. S2M10]
MLPRRPSSLFRSRWAALLWAAGVLWTAVTVAGAGASQGPSPPIENAADALGQPIDKEDLALLRNLTG